MTVTREDHSNTRQSILFPPAKIEATADTIAAFDLTGFSAALISGIVGASDVDLDGANSLAIELQHSDNGVDFEGCSDDDLAGSVVGINQGTFGVVSAAVPAEGIGFKASYKGVKRYIRPVIRCVGDDHGNEDHGTMIAVSVLSRGAKYLPVT